MMVRRRIFKSGAACAAAIALLGAGAASQPGPATVDEIRSRAADIPRLHSVLVSWRGTLLIEHYGKGVRPERPANVKSVSKSIISALVGIAIERRLISSVSTPISNYFPELRKDPHPAKRRITVEDLLTMRTGLESTSFDGYGAWVRSRNWVHYVLSRPMVAEPSSVMEYSTGSTHLLSAILTIATKQTTHQFARAALAAPLGISLPLWPRDPQGIFFGGNEMRLTPRAMVAFGELYRRRGSWNGRQIVPADWAAASCVERGRSRFNPDQGYGYGWWTRRFAGRDSCFAWGFGGQYIFVFPDLELVVVTTSAADVSDERRDHRRQIFDLLERSILPYVEGHAGRGTQSRTPDSGVRHTTLEMATR